MSLFKQMAITFTLFLALVLTSVMVLNFNTATEFTQHQLYTEAKNTAHSLGLSLAKAASPDDLVLMETMINAIFDSGYYERIALVATDGTPITLRETKVLLDDVPQWFINAIELESISAHSDIMMGWHQFGTLEVKGHTGNAYRQLYHTFWELCKTFALFGVLVFGVLYILLSLSLQSLKRIANQARAIIDNAFIVEKELPFTTEFRSTTKAMNAMVEKVKDIFDRENETLKRYHELLYIDAQTKFYNRRYVNTTLPDYLHADSGVSQGAYALVGLDGGERFKRNEGYERYGELIRSLTAALKEQFSAKENALLARLNENDFFALLPSGNPQDMATRMEKVMGSLLPLLRDIELTTSYIAGCSVGAYHENETLKTLFSKADYGLMFSKNEGTFTVHVNQEEDPTLGREEWKETLLQSLQESRFPLAHQEVIEAHQGTCVHAEIFLRWKDPKGTLRTAGHFMPIATRLGLMEALDRHMVEKVLLHVKTAPSALSLALNLSGDFIQNPENLQWLETRLKEIPLKLRKTLWFETHNTLALSASEHVLLLSQLLKRQKCHFGLDHFTMPSEGADYLQALRPDYLKASNAYLHDVFFDTHTGEQREHLANLVRSLGISLVAINTETKAQKEALVPMGVVYFQGNGISPVVLLEG